MIPAQELHLLAHEALNRQDFKHCAEYCHTLLKATNERNYVQDKIKLDCIYMLLFIYDIWNKQCNLPSIEKWARHDLFSLAETYHVEKLSLDTHIKLKVLKGKYLANTKSSEAAILAIQDAVVLAENSCTHYVKALALAELGHKTMKINLKRGRELIRQAYDILHQSPMNHELSLENQRHIHFISSIHGICEFDCGNYETAMKHLSSVYQSSLRLGIKSDTSIFCNYLAQVHMGFGDYETAESLLLSSLENFISEKTPHAWNANNRALLGKVYIEWGKYDKAREHLTIGWKESRLARCLPLITLVRNYYAEFLLQRENSPSKQNIALAEEILQENISEARRAGIYRSEILSLSLMGQISLNRNDFSAAKKYSQSAIDMLINMGWLPALRAQEIYMNHHIVAMSCGDVEQKKHWLSEAYNVVMSIAHRILDDTRRLSFLSRVKINDMIVHKYTEI
ncbi:tetratricopeptide repeat protein [Photorhabdus luminescens]|uniref:Tetratricopeptide repeat protein n=1 Tax=Photorhabdus luminescens subsp. sonorensis TaxID=1173677 RepID=A0A5C4RIT6_PHOLU|nr:tetratricopeptide repeat protein [Photorhabdus luminescens]TNH43738.1 tetratricopeptide repeat protein [Photorhabdus luminescens subsp. sonorensis]